MAPVVTTSSTTITCRQPRNAPAWRRAKAPRRFPRRSAAPRRIARASVARDDRGRAASGHCRAWHSARAISSAWLKPRSASRRQCRGTGTTASGASGRAGMRSASSSPSPRATGTCRPNLAAAIRRSTGYSYVRADAAAPKCHCAGGDWPGASSQGRSFRHPAQAGAPAADGPAQQAARRKQGVKDLVNPTPVHKLTASGVVPILPVDLTRRDQSVPRQKQGLSMEMSTGRQQEHRGDTRTDWTVAEVAALFALPLHELLFRAHSTHRRALRPGRGPDQHPDEHQDRRLPRGLWLLSAERSLRHRADAGSTGTAGRRRRRSPHGP